MSANLAAVVERCYRAAIARVHAGHAVRAALRREGDELTLDGQRLPLDHGLYAIALGKAAVEMVSAVEELAGDAWRDGIAVTKAAPDEYRGRARVLLGAHPTPDERSLAAGAALLDFARRVPDGALVVCLISGGGSALAEDLRPGVSLEELRRVTDALLGAGASIHELNAVRARLSALKAGGLLAALQQATVVNLIVSDVLGDDLSVIASGPTVPPTTMRDAQAIVGAYGVQAKLPPAADRPDLSMPLTRVVANVSTAVDAAAAAAREAGYTPVVLTRAFDGEAREVGRLLATIVADTAAGRSSFTPPVALLAGGETVVTVRGDGRGGRNTEAALAAALRLRGIAHVALGCLATDGDDAHTHAAGAIVTGATIPDDQVAAAQAALDRNDSYTPLDAAGALLRTGPTGTNVNDLVLGVVGT